MRLIQFNVYFVHHLHIFMLSCITYIVRVGARTVWTGIVYCSSDIGNPNTDIKSTILLAVKFINFKYKPNVLQRLYGLQYVQSTNVTNA